MCQCCCSKEDRPTTGWMEFVDGAELVCRYLTWLAVWAAATHFVVKFW